MRTNLVIVENGKFIFDTNFAGDPKKDRFGSDERKANLVIPDIDLATIKMRRSTMSASSRRKATGHVFWLKRRKVLNLRSISP